ncbi:myeloid differentiation primary response protein MyD88-like [Cochliomyia hominivorax]
MPENVISNTDTMEIVPLKELENPDFKKAPLQALSVETLRKLSNFLNNLMIIHASNGYERDWRGLASLAQQSNKRDLQTLQTNDPCKRVIELWCEHNSATATFGNLIIYLGLIDRWHIIEDIQENFKQDFLHYQQATCRSQNPSLELSNFNHASLSTPQIDSNETITFSYESETKVLTSIDVQNFQQGLPLQRYDAFLLYADVDYNYALEILLKLQNNPRYNYKFCLKDDLLFGIPFEHIALMDLIRERCKFLIVILTKEFTKSPENRFFVNYAQALQIKQEIRKVIPLMYEEQVELPANLAMFSCMRYNPQRSEFYWSKLANSMQLLQFGQGISTYSATFRSSIENQRPLSRNLAIEEKNCHNHLELTKSVFLTENNKNVVRRKKLCETMNHVKIRKNGTKSGNDFEKSLNQESSICRRAKRKGIIRKIFCCHK